MALDLSLRVSKEDFEARIATVQLKMDALRDVINRYQDAKRNLDQFLEGNDSNYDAMIERIDVNIKAAGKSYAALQQTKVSLEETVSQMAGMSSQVSSTLDAAIEAAGSTVNAALHIQEIL